MARTSPAMTNSSATLQDDRALVPKLLAQNALVQVMPGIKQHVHRHIAVHADIDATHATNFVVIGDGGNRALAGFEHFDRHPRLIGQQCTAPTARTEWTDRCER